MKFAVGIMLTTFGIFWAAEGAGADWPGGDAALLGVLAFVIASAIAALIVVVIVGAIVHKPLTRVPENTLKFAVGVMLTAFGTFWGSEGAGATWPGGDAALLVLIAGYALLAFAIVAWLKARAVRGAYA